MHCNNYSPLYIAINKNTKPTTAAAPINILIIHWMVDHVLRESPPVLGVEHVTVGKPSI